jgi:hypothetical protein
MNRKERKTGAMHFKESEFYHFLPGGNIRGKPHALHNTGLLAGGHVTNFMRVSGTVMVSLQGSFKSRKFLGQREMCPKQTRKSRCDKMEKDVYLT